MLVIFALSSAKSGSSSERIRSNNKTIERTSPAEPLAMLKERDQLGHRPRSNPSAMLLEIDKAALWIWFRNPE